VDQTCITTLPLRVTESKKDEQFMECVCLAEVGLPSSHDAPMKEKGVDLSLVWVNGVAS
jgi:hypothetical protein